MAAITQGEIKVKTMVPIRDLRELEMNVSKNRHASVRLAGIIPEELGDGFLLRSVGQDRMEVWAGEEMLFSGILEEVHVAREGNGYSVVMEGISVSGLLDSRKKNRTFQKADATYGEVIQAALGDSGAEAIFTAKDRRTGGVLYQIDETDWEFLCRLAGHLGTSVVPSVLLSGIGIYVGLPNGKVRDGSGADPVRERVFMDRENHCICQEIAAYENWNIGDHVEWTGQEYTVIRKGCRLEHGLLRFRYTVSRREAFSAGRYGNPLHAGRLLPATVLDRKDELVKVHFDMDREQREEDAFWYPWRPDVGNLMYCMPEKGEKVYIHLGDCDGKQARAVCGLHGNGAGNPEMKSSDRYFTTAGHKRMFLLPDSMGFRDLKQESPLEMVLDDGTGASVVSNKNIVISAKDSIGLKGDTIFLQAPQELSIVRRDASAPTVINMCNGFDSVGATNEVTMAGAGEANFPLFHEEVPKEGKEYGLEGLEKDILASTPGVGLEAGLERQTGAAMVNRLMRD